MRSSFRASLTMFAASVFAVAAVAGAAAQADNSPRMHGMQHWAVDHEALLNAKLAGLKAGLGLNADQEKLWGPFEAAVRDAAQLRMQRMKERMEMRGTMGRDMGEDEHEGEAVSPIDRLEALADRLSETGAAIKKVADAAQPLYASLDDTQKRVFVMLSRDMMMLGHEHGGMMEHGDHGWGPPHRYRQGPDDEE
jgi:zinc resistance-associated protein